MPQWRIMPKAYLWGCGALFVTYEILFLIAVALTHNREQVLLVTMINYLWPPMTILFSICARHLYARWYVIVGFILTILGVLLVIQPDFMQFQHIWGVLQQNPLSYGLALIAALLWPAYCVLTKTYAQGHNAVTLFFYFVCRSVVVDSFDFKRAIYMARSKFNCFHLVGRHLYWFGIPKLESKYAVWASTVTDVYDLFYARPLCRDVNVAIRCTPSAELLGGCFTGDFGCADLLVCDLRS